MRADGIPWAVAVDKDIASGSITPEEGSRAEESHDWNCLMGDGSTVVGERTVVEEYCIRVVISIAGSAGSLPIVGQLYSRRRGRAEKTWLGHVRVVTEGSILGRLGRRVALIAVLSMASVSPSTYL